jgi:hypothetical protein
MPEMSSPHENSDMKDVSSGKNISSIFFYLHPSPPQTPKNDGMINFVQK